MKFCALSNASFGPFLILVIYNSCFLSAEEQYLRQRIDQLQEWRRMGITKLKDGELYEKLKTERVRGLYYDYSTFVSELA